MWRSEIARKELAEKYHRYAWWVAWPLIVLAVFSGCARSCSSDPAATSYSVQQQITNYGSTAILTYLTATPADGSRLADVFGELTKPPTGQQGVPLPRRTVLASFANAEPAGGNADSADWLVELTAITTDGSETWQVPVRVFGDAYRVTQLPGLVPGLTTGPPISADAATPIEVCSSTASRRGAGPCTDSPIAATLRDFFNAWLTGNGDLSRVADTDAVQAFSSPPFSKAQIVSASSATQVPDQPAGDLTTSVIVWGAKTKTVQLSYTLKLTASAGRWVVTDISAVPSVREEKTESPTAPAGP